MRRSQPPGASGVFSGDAGEIMRTNMLWRVDLIVTTLYRCKGGMFQTFIILKIKTKSNLICNLILLSIFGQVFNGNKIHVCDVLRFA